MAASTAERYDLKRVALNNIVLPMAASTKIYKGTAVCVDASGNANPGADTSGLKFFGFANLTVDNSSGSAGALNIDVEPITIDSEQQITTFNCTNAAQSWVGQHVFLLDDNSVGLVGSSTNKVIVGRVLQIIGTSGSASQVIVDCIDRFALGALA